MKNKEKVLIKYEYRLGDRFLWLMLLVLVTSTCYFINLAFHIALILTMPFLICWVVLDREKISFHDDCVIILGNWISKEDLIIKYKDVKYIKVQHLDALESKFTRAILTIHLDENLQNSKHNLSINSYFEAGQLIRFLNHKGVDIQFNDKSFEKYIFENE